MCRRAAARTSGHHPEPDPELSMATARPYASPAVGPSVLAPRVQQASLNEGGEWMPAIPGGRKSSQCRLSARFRGVRLLTRHFVGRAGELGSLERLLDELDRGCPGAVGRGRACDIVELMHRRQRVAEAPKPARMAASPNNSTKLAVTVPLTTSARTVGRRPPRPPGSSLR